MRRNNSSGSNLPVLRSRREMLNERYRRDRYDNRESSYEDYDDYDDDWDIYETEIDNSNRYAPSSPSPRNYRGKYRDELHHVRGLRSAYTPETNPDEDEEYDYTYDPEYNERDRDYEYASEYARRKPRHTQTYRDDDGRWEYGARGRSLRHGLNSRRRSRLYNGLTSEYDY